MFSIIYIYSYSCYCFDGQREQPIRGTEDDMWQIKFSFWQRVRLKQSDAQRSLFLRNYIPGNTGYTARIAVHPTHLLADCHARSL